MHNNLHRVSRTEIKLAISVQIHKMLAQGESPDPTDFMSEITKSMVPSMAKNPIRAHALVIPLIDEVVRDSINNSKIIEIVKAGEELKTVSKDELAYFESAHSNIDRILERTQTDLNLLSPKFAKRRSELTNSKEVLGLEKELGIKLGVKLSDALDGATKSAKLIEQLRKELNNAVHPEYEEAKNISELVN